MILGLGTGTAACLGEGGSPDDAGSKPLIRDGLASGAYPYVMACQVFTAADLRSVAGRAADPTIVQGKYSAQFPRTVPQDTVFASSCTRNSQRPGEQTLPDIYRVSIDQYPGTAVIKKMIKHPPKIRGSQIRMPGLAGTFGNGAIANRGLQSGSVILSFFYQNKAIDVGITPAPGYRGNPQAKAIALGKRVLGRLRSSASPRAFVMGPAGGQLAGLRYFPACRLLKLADTKAAFRGLTIDTANITFTYGEGLTRNKLAEESIAEAGGGTRVVYNDLSGQCGYAVGTGDSQFEVVISTEQEFNRGAEAQEELSSRYRQNTLDEKISGVGQAAKIATPKTVLTSNVSAELLIRYPHVLVQVGLADFKGTNSQRLGYLRKIARQLPARLP